MCNFSIEFKSKPDELIQKAKDAIEGQGGIFTNDGNIGIFSFTDPAKIKGCYKVVGSFVTITIITKPFYVSCSTIESKLRALNL
jgi:hypothetical protein